MRGEILSWMRDARKYTCTYTYIGFVSYVPDLGHCYCRLANTTGFSWISFFFLFIFISGLADAIAENPGIIYRGMVEVVDNIEAKYIQAVREAVTERSSVDKSSDWDGIALLLGGASQVELCMKVLALHPKAIVGSFDVSESMFEPFSDGRLKFGIDQQPFLQGAMPVYLLTYGEHS